MTSPIRPKTLDVHASRYAAKNTVAEEIDKRGNKDGRVDQQEVDSFIQAETGSTRLGAGGDVAAAAAIQKDLKSEDNSADSAVAQSPFEQFGGWVAHAVGIDKPKE
jgi:hypothetical protein